MSADLWRCAACDATYPVPSLARDCENRHKEVHVELTEFITALTEFVRARLDEDEAVLQARSTGRHSDYHGGDTVETFSRSCPVCLAGWPGRAHALAVIQAHRRIVTGWSEDFGWGTKDPWMIVELAAIYSDHPDFDPVWRLDTPS